jgi:hypothetical protein
VGQRSPVQRHAARIEAAFPAGTLCLPAHKPGNVIVPSHFAIRRARCAGPTSAQGAGLEARYGLEFPLFVQALRTMNRHDEDADLYE